MRTVSSYYRKSISNKGLAGSKEDCTKIMKIVLGRSCIYFDIPTNSVCFPPKTNFLKSYFFLKFLTHYFQNCFSRKMFATPSQPHHHNQELYFKFLEGILVDAISKGSGN